MTETDVERMPDHGAFCPWRRRTGLRPDRGRRATIRRRPHAHARADYAIKPGDALLIDFGGRKGGFCADITRTVFVGHATDEAQAVYDTVLRANLRGHAITRPGVTAHAIDDAVTACWRRRPLPTASAPRPATALAAMCMRRPISCAATCR